MVIAICKCVVAVTGGSVSVHGVCLVSTEWQPSGNRRDSGRCARVVLVVTERGMGWGGGFLGNGGMGHMGGIRSHKQQPGCSGHSTMVERCACLFENVPVLCPLQVTRGSVVIASHHARTGTETSVIHMGVRSTCRKSCDPKCQQERIYWPVHVGDVGIPCRLPTFLQLCDARSRPGPFQLRLTPCYLFCS